MNFYCVLCVFQSIIAKETIHCREVLTVIMITDSRLVLTTLHIFVLTWLLELLKALQMAPV